MGLSRAHWPSAGPAEANGFPEAHGPPHGPPRVHGPRGHCTPLPRPLSLAMYNCTIICLSMCMLYSVHHYTLLILFIF